MKDATHLVPVDQVGPLARTSTRTARRLVEASVAANTRRAYTGALRLLDAWLDGRQLDDAALATYLGHLYDQGRAAASAAIAVAAVRFRARLAGDPDPSGEATARVLAGFRRTTTDRGRGQAAAMTYDDLVSILSTADRHRHNRRGWESAATAARRGRLDKVIAALLFMGGLRRSEAATLRWCDITDAGDSKGVLVKVRRSKTNQDGQTADVRYLKNGAAAAIRALRAAVQPADEDRVVPLSAKMVGLRLSAAAAAAGIERRLTAHSGRVGLASELTRRGASTTAVMLAGNWKTSRMVAAYSAGATAERGAVAQHF